MGRVESQKKGYMERDESGRERETIPLTIS
jgi:hypothetical protein